MHWKLIKHSLVEAATWLVASIATRETAAKRRWCDRVQRSTTFITNHYSLEAYLSGNRIIEWAVCIARGRSAAHAGNDELSVDEARGMASSKTQFVLHFRMEKWRREKDGALTLRGRLMQIN